MNNSIQIPKDIPEFEVVTRNNLSLKIDSLMSNALNGEGNETSMAV